MNHLNDLFVTKEVAIELSKLGFDEECMAYFPTDGKLVYGGSNYHEPVTFLNSKEGKVIVPAPTIQQVIDWLCETHEINIIVNVIRLDVGKADIRYETTVYSDLVETESEDEVYFLTRREAYLDGINYALELLKNKK